MLDTTSTTTNDVQQLLDTFESGKLVRPRFDAPSIADLSTGILDWAGVPGLTLYNNAERIADTFATAKHLVLIVVDGLGLNFVNKMDGTSFLPKHVALELQTVFHRRLLRRSHPSQRRSGPARTVSSVGTCT